MTRSGESTDAGLAAGYVRVSQVGGRGGDSFLSPELQRERIEAWAAYRQHRIVEWYTDLDVSGRTGVRRPEFERLMADARAGRFGIVAVYRLTRFGRSVKDTATRYEELRQLGVGLVSVTEDIDTTTAGGKFMQNMLFAMAEFESERIGEEWSSVHRTRRGRGLAHASRGVYGYHTEGAVPVSPDPAEARAVRGAYLLRADGASLGHVRRWLHDEGYRPRGGGDYFAASTVRRMLSNPLYAGMVEADGQVIAGRHEAIVPRDVWDRVQALHAHAATVTRYRVGLVAGLVVCATCGYRMQAFTLRGERYYRCSAAKMTRPCQHPTIMAMPKLDAHVEQMLLRRLDPRRMPRGGRARAGDAEARQRRRSQLDRRAADLARALDRLADERYLLGSLSQDEYQRQAARLVDERSRVEREAEETAAAAARTVKMRAWSSDAWHRLPLERRQRIARAMIHRVHVKPSRRGGARWVKASDRATIEWL